MDLQLDFSKYMIENTDLPLTDMAGSPNANFKALTKMKPTTLIKVGLQIANIDIKLTTKEVKDMKLFCDKFIKYHTDLDDQVKEELIKIRLQEQFRQSINKNSSSIAESLQLQAQRNQLRQIDTGKVIVDAVKKTGPGESGENGEVEHRAISTIQSF